ncbi:MAG: isochorismatase family protein [Gaiellaceae bacterium]
MTRAILWDVDTQVDFMLPEGRLYVPGAEALRPTMARLVEAARAAGIVHVASADDHELTDSEISDEPDFERTYPPHCLRGTPGVERVPETKQIDPLPLSEQALPRERLAKLIAGRREILILKKHFDVFTNPSTEALIELLDPEEIVLFGVATDVCDDAAILGMLRLGRRVRFVEDAARGLDPDRVERCLAHWRERGVAFAHSDEIVSSFSAAI